jgi:hypothetical protein
VRGEGVGEREEGMEERTMEVLECEAMCRRRSSETAKVSPQSPQMYGRSCRKQHESAMRGLVG